MNDLVSRLRDHANEGVTGSDRFHLRQEAAHRIEQLDQALRLCDGYCDHLHHAKEHQHKLGEPCPVESIVRAALS